MFGVPFHKRRSNAKILEFFSGLETVPAEQSQSDSGNRRAEFIEDLRKIFDLHGAIEKRGGDSCERDLKNLEDDVKEVLSRNSHLTGIRVA